ncbi:MAG: helix-turn-helix domain-containing protein [Candidatus Gottesmanbacteria bacterium]|nr:helix-turn-helix domain-containing protein [Candidatus Gottesmanbacteria bacterium]
MKHDLVSIGNAAQRLGVSIDTIRRWDAKGRLPSVRSGKRGHRYYRASDIEQYSQDPETPALEWARATHGLEPSNDVYCKTRDVFAARLEQLQSTLDRTAPLSTTSLITAIAGEIGNNSFDHNLGNWPDIPGIFFSYTPRNKTIALADRGQGILTTLKRVRPELTRPDEALKLAFTETISGRHPETRGNGLKFVRSIITDNPFTLSFQTGNAYLYLQQHEENLPIQLAKTTIRGCLAIIRFGEVV